MLHLYRVCQSTRSLLPHLASCSSSTSVAPTSVRALLPLSNKAHGSLAPTNEHLDTAAYMLAGSINLPAHSFYPSRHTLAKLLAGSGTLVFYCNSSNGRGPRCAGWMRDTLVEAGLADRVQVKILAGGAKAFIAKYQHDSQRVVKMPDEVTSS